MIFILSVSWTRPMRIIYGSQITEMLLVCIFTIWRTSMNHQRLPDINVLTRNYNAFDFLIVFMQHDRRLFSRDITVIWHVHNGLLLSRRLRCWSIHVGAMAGSDVTLSICVGGWHLGKWGKCKLWMSGPIFGTTVLCRDGWQFTGNAIVIFRLLVQE